MHQVERLGPVRKLVKDGVVPPDLRWLQVTKKLWFTYHEDLTDGAGAYFTKKGGTLTKAEKRAAKEKAEEDAPVAEKYAKQEKKKAKLVRKIEKACKNQNFGKLAMYQKQLETMSATLCELQLQVRDEMRANGRIDEYIAMRNGDELAGNTGQEIAIMPPDSIPTAHHQPGNESASPLPPSLALLINDVSDDVASLVPSELEIRSLSPSTGRPGVEYMFISTKSGLIELCERGGIWRGEGDEYTVVIDVEGVPGHVSLLQICVDVSSIYVFDGLAIGEQTLLDALTPFFQARNVLKVLHDVHMDALGIWQKSAEKLSLQGVLDTQLVMEACSTKEGEMFSGFNTVLAEWHPNGKLTQHPTKAMIHQIMDANKQFVLQRPLSTAFLEYAVLDVLLLHECIPTILRVLSSGVGNKSVQQLVEASEQRAINAVKNNGNRSVWVDEACRLASVELLALRGVTPTMLSKTIDPDMDSLLRLLPARFRNAPLFEQPEMIFRIIDVVLDKGRQAYVFVDGQGRKLLLESEGDAGNTEALVTPEDIALVVQNIGMRKFGGDNRAGIDGSLHRISAMRNKANEVYGLTLRVGRAFPGVSDVVLDVLHSSGPAASSSAISIGGVPAPSVLILGLPGHGKTTLIRDIARSLSCSGHQSVCIIDTSNEIGGDGDVPHHHVGYARRMMVPSLDVQAQVMVECVQNHTVSTMIIDEIGRLAEVVAAQTVRQRGVAIIASAHGDLRSLIKNSELCGLVGGIETVTIGDEVAKKRSGSKSKTQRMHAPTFDVIVEVKGRNEYVVIFNTAQAVDDILEGRFVKGQWRSRDPETGSIRMQLVRV
uniref:AAA+ ATPase domain-containing protein n=1 Tax=Globisporangium ultimum (strain ATCC 200006 / CBS 805.95 / DAOM BR144) TaxID=431595 RepID=K3WXX3_GLOUD